VNITVLGTGSVGRTLAARLAELGHRVAMGTRDVAATRSRAADGEPPFAAWEREHPAVTLVAFGEVPAETELFVNATAGSGAVPALTAVGADRLDGRVVLDVSNPLDFSGGFPPRLSVVNDDSLGEQIQRAFPRARVVKALNTVTASVMVAPQSLEGEHVVPVCGADDDAKALVTVLLHELGWPTSAVLDLGGLRSARSMEMYLPLWLSIMQSLGTAEFNIGVLRRPESP
jgi:predicted dinucleotide-binding enzyme